MTRVIILIIYLILFIYLSENLKNHPFFIIYPPMTRIKTPWHLKIKIKYRPLYLRWKSNKRKNILQFIFIFSHSPNLTKTKTQEHVLLMKNQETSLQFFVQINLLLLKEIGNTITIDGQIFKLKSGSAIESKISLSNWFFVCWKGLKILPSLMDKLQALKWAYNQIANFELKSILYCWKGLKILLK